MNDAGYRACRAMLYAAVLGFTASAEAAGIQHQDKFATAIRNMSSGPSVVLLTVVDDRTRQSRTGCALVPFLLGAIQREMGVSKDKAIDVALANATHEFHFSKQDAIDNIPFITTPSGVCTAVEHDLSVVMRHRTGDFLIVETGEVIGRHE